MSMDMLCLIADAVEGNVSGLVRVSEFSWRLQNVGRETISERPRPSTGYVLYTNMSIYAVRVLRAHLGGYLGASDHQTANFL